MEGLGMLIERNNEGGGHVEEAGKRVGRDPREVTVIAVSKTKPVEVLQEAYDLGVRVFGENKKNTEQKKRASTSLNSRQR